MKNKYLIASVALATVLAISSIASAQYEDMIRDDEGNVMRIVGEYEDDWIFVESPNIDITQVRVSETDEVVTVSLNVKGRITDDPNIYYEIDLKDYRDGEFNIVYSNGDCRMTAYFTFESGAFGNDFEPETNGVGTNKLTIMFSREQIGDPEVLLISRARAINERNMEVDMAGPDAEYPPGYEDTYQEPVDDPDDSIPEGPRDDTDEVNGTPGLGFMSLVLGLLFVVGAYYKKKR